MLRRVSAIATAAVALMATMMTSASAANFIEPYTSGGTSWGVLGDVQVRRPAVAPGSFYDFKLAQRSVCECRNAFLGLRSDSNGSVIYIRQNQQSGAVATSAMGSVPSSVPSYRYKRVFMNLGPGLNRDGSAVDIVRFNTDTMTALGQGEVTGFDTAGVRSYMLTDGTSLGRTNANNLFYLPTRRGSFTAFGPNRGSPVQQGVVCRRIESNTSFSTYHGVSTC